MRAKTTSIVASGSGVVSASMALPTCRLVGIFLDIDSLGTGATFVFTSMGRTIVTLTTPSADTYVPIGELVDTAAGAASTSYGKGGALVHAALGIAATGAADLGAGSITAFYS